VPTPLDAARVTRGLTPRLRSQQPARFCLPELAGRLTELSGQGASAALTFAVKLVLDAQLRGEPVAWVTSTASVFYPPDAADSGIDLSTLIVVRVPSERARLRETMAVAADRLLRSGGFGLVVLDLAQVEQHGHGQQPELAQALQSRLLGLAQRHQSALLCLTDKSAAAPSLGSLVSLRLQAARTWLAEDRFECSLSAIKDKERGPSWSEREVCRGPLGLR
jgi:recombination protein RecA